MASPERPIESPHKLDSGNTVVFSATNIYRQRTGVHAQVRIEMDHIRLASDIFNVNRLADKVRLVNEAHTQLGDKGHLITKIWLKYELDNFCEALWSRYLDTLDIEPLKPLPMQQSVFLLRPYVVRGGGTYLFAPPGAGKSYTLYLMAVSVDTGVEELWPVTQQRILVVNLERSAESVARRLACVNAVLGEDPERPLLVLNRRGRKLSQVAEEVERIVDKYRVTVGFVDSISRAGLGKLTEDDPANEGTDLLNNLFPSWLALGHTPRATDSHMFGSAMWDAGADIMTRLTAEDRDSDLGIMLEITKKNDIPKQPRQFLKYSFDEYGLSDVEKSQPSQWPMLMAGRNTEMDEAILDYLRDVGQATSTQDIAAALGYSRQNVSSFLNADKRIVKTRREGKTWLYGRKSSFD